MDAMNLSKSENPSNGEMDRQDDDVQNPPLNLKRVMLKQDDIEIGHIRDIDFDKNRKYRKIVSSIRSLGMLEPLSVYMEADSYILLDGYLRWKAAEELGMDELPCFIYPDRDSYTFNAMRNELSPLQESKMIQRAVSQGVDEKDLAAVLNIQVDRIRKVRKLSENLVPKAKELLESKQIHSSTAEQLIRVDDESQHSILKKMDEIGNYNASYAKLLVMKTPKEKMRNRTVQKREGVDPAKKRSRLYTQIRKGDEEIEFYSKNYKDNMKEFMKQVVFFRAIFERESTSNYLSNRHPQIAERVHRILSRSETEILEA